MLYPSAEDFLAHRARYQYGRRGTPTTEALEQAVQELEGPQCAGVALLPSGLAAISAAILSVVRAGEHVLVTDSAYGPTRAFCDQILTRLGVTTTYYDPLIGGGIAELMQPNTRAVFTESPGSLSFEMQDIPAIAEAAHAKGALVLMDNTWATPLYFRALDFGVDLSIHAGTKYFGGHSDVMLGTVAANSATIADLRNFVRLNGLHLAPDDAYLSQRGLRTLGVRLDRHYESGLAVARWLEQRPEVLRLLHPAMPSHPGHALWKRDFGGASGLFSMVLKPVPQPAVFRFPRCARTVRHRRLVGRLREPRDSVRLHQSAHRDALGAGRPDRALSYRARSGRRFDCRPRAGFCCARSSGALVSASRPSRRLIPAKSGIQVRMWPLD